MSLSTHVLDVVHGRPADGMKVTLLRDGAILYEGVTDSDGRCPPLRELALPPGSYRLIFGVADYFRSKGVALSDPPFLDAVPIDFAMAADGGHYHVPLLTSPFSYSTYRGS
ncbi:hydroxyisourate hydrolase [Sphingobium boeckii]|uniref:5-hydroxyisourate hydrolase n=1 Tax=Sphingobium boeckii TaxID=1082345 RepID=A0A7W9AHS8_9SPHN|nr:hydroxyisourate hydrolase [Sphingobium boeckii]MBB5685704.1 5-hydroxyisourate hydrolase [Sphingobium boeckii]